MCLAYISSFTIFINSIGNENATCSMNFANYLRSHLNEGFKNHSRRTTAERGCEVFLNNYYKTRSTVYI